MVKGTQAVQPGAQAGPLKMSSCCEGAPRRTHTRPAAEVPTGFPTPARAASSSRVLPWRASQLPAVYALEGVPRAGAISQSCQVWPPLPVQSPACTVPAGSAAPEEGELPEQLQKTEPRQALGEKGRWPCSQAEEMNTSGVGPMRAPGTGGLRETWVCSRSPLSHPGAV